ENSLPENRSPQGLNIGQGEMRVAAGMRLILGEEFAHARVINIGPIDALQVGAIAVHKPLSIHTRFEIEPQIEIVSVAIAYDAAFLLQPAIELSTRKRLQQSDHGKRDGAFLNELHLPIEDVVGIVIESDDEASHDFHAVVLDAADVLKETAVGVLHLLRLFEAFFRRRFDAKKYAIEAGVFHHLQQLLVVGEINGGFGIKPERPAMPDIPFRQHRQKLLFLALISDEIIIHDENRAAPFARVKQFELGHHLRRRFCPRFAAIDLDNIAKLAIEGTAAGVLDGHGTVIFRTDQIEFGKGRRVQARKFFGLVERLCVAALETRGEVGNQFFRFSYNDVVRIQREIQHATADWAANHSSQPACA